ncbi:MAG: hypothetical protein GQ527_07205, partial [Bacteroidales bacterium]|nr:hypothetical protein [Bacteroidales bacterium]
MSDFNDYHTNGMSSTIQWTPLSSSTVMCSSSDWQPSFFVNEDSLLNVRITGEIYVSSTTNDDDFIGFVFGYRSPNAETEPNNNHFYLFDWKKVGQHAPDEYGGFLAKEGFNLSYVNGTIDNDPIATYQHFWGHENNESFTHLDEQYGNYMGWEFNTIHNFELIYTYNKISISIDGDEIFNLDGCFSPGLFGLYSFNQNGARYSNIVIEQYYEMNVFGDHDTFCEDVPINFNFTDTSCAGVPQSLSHFEWSFGDGTSNTEDLLPQHIFQDPGIYNVELLLTDLNNCIDTISQSIFIDPKPIVENHPEDNLCSVGDA